MHRLLSKFLIPITSYQYIEEFRIKSKNNVLFKKYIKIKGKNGKKMAHITARYSAIEASVTVEIADVPL